MRIVTVSNSTLSPLATALARHEVVTSGVADLMSWLIDPRSPAAAPETDLVFICPDGDSTLPPLGYERASDELLELVERFVERHPSKQIVVSTLVGGRRTVSSFADLADPAGRFATRARWEAGLANLASNTANVAILDLGELAERLGRENFLTTTYWYLGRIRFSTAGFDAIAEELERIVSGTLHLARKVLVLDLDNTLWGGVIGEDGVGGILLGEDGIGKCYRDFQRQLSALRRTGTLLALVSKNDPHLVDEVFERHPMMVLDRDDFVAIDASWSNKADRIRNLAGALSLGLDSFVFIDDSPVERELVRDQIPAVAVPDFPDSPDRLSSWLVEDVVPTWFPRIRVLDEDRTKTEQYRSLQLRQQAEESDMDAFLASLDIRLSFRVDDEHLVPRISQLTQKTNQFNLTTERLSPADVMRLVSAENVVVLACDYSDRFGDEGTIGVAIVDCASGEVRNVLLSCRVLSRGVEDALLAEAERVAGARGVLRLQARYVPNARNGVAQGFLERCGYTPVDVDEEWIGEKVIA